MTFLESTFSNFYDKAASLQMLSELKTLLLSPPYWISDTTFLSGIKSLRLISSFSDSPARRSLWVSSTATSSWKPRLKSTSDILSTLNFSRFNASGFQSLGFSFELHPLYLLRFGQLSCIVYKFITNKRVNKSLKFIMNLLNDNSQV